MIRLDERVIGLLQWLYDQLLDRMDTRIGSFRMAVALLPIVSEATARVVRGNAPSAVVPDLLFVVGVSIYYSFRMMRTDDRLQSRRKLLVINSRSLRFRSQHVGLRLFYLFFFSTSLIFHHNVGGLGMLAIVYARCVTVRERRTPRGRRRHALVPA